MKQPMLSFPSSNFLLQAQLPTVQRLSLSEENRSDPAAFCPAEINRWIARWENEGGAGALIQDEGFWGTLRFAWNLLRDVEARRCVIAMRRVFAKNRRHLSAIMLVGIKRPECARNNAHPKKEFGHNEGAPFEPASKLEMSWRRASFH
jgi:hypothetical protein